MIQVYKNLYVGDDDDYEKVKGNSDFYILRCCKEGPAGHRAILKYDSQAAPKGSNYLSAEKGRVLALNFIDTDSPDFVPGKMVDEGLAFVSEHLSDSKVLVACNRGLSRAPTIALLWLYANDKLPATYHAALSAFRKLYPKYDPMLGLEVFARRKIQELKYR